MARSQTQLRFSKKRKSSSRRKKRVTVRSYTRKQGKLPSRDSKGRFKKKGRTTRRR